MYSSYQLGLTRIQIVAWILRANCEGNYSISEKKETGVKRKSVAADNGEAEKTTPEKKAKVAEEAAPAEAEEAAA